MLSRRSHISAPEMTLIEFYRGGKESSTGLLCHVTVSISKCLIEAIINSISLYFKIGKDIMLCYFFALHFRASIFQSVARGTPEEREKR